eukprot:jgi/Mesvir1/22285/Mv17044-RA.1
MWDIISRSDNNDDTLNGPNCVVIPQQSLDCVTFHSMKVAWSYEEIANKLGGRPELYDIFKPLSIKTPVSVGVYFANPDKGKNTLASKGGSFSSAASDAGGAMGPMFVG